MTEALAVSNGKGGVGKTVVAINVAAALSQRGQRVLFVDLDPQGNATEGWGLTDRYADPPPSLFDVLTEREHREDINHLIHGVVADRLDVLPSNIDMTGVEPELVLARRGGERLALAFEELDYDYDFIVIDCPPYLLYLVENALYAARNVLVPALAETTSKRAVEILYDHIEVLEGDYRIAVDDVGVVINRIDTRKNEAHDMIDWFETAFPDRPVWRVRERASIQRAFARGTSIFALEEDVDMEGVFLDIADGLVANAEGDHE